MLSNDIINALPEEYTKYMLDRMHEAFNPLIVSANDNIS